MPNSQGILLAKVTGGSMTIRKRCAHAAAFWRPGCHAVFLAAVVLGINQVPAATAGSGDPDPLQATESPAARQNAIQSIPFDKLDADARAKVKGVLSNVTVFRRLPIRAVNCDPDLYLFLVRHPDVVVNIWEVLGIGQLQLRQTAIDTYRVVETEGTSATVEMLYHTNNTHVIYGAWAYKGPLLGRKISGHCLAILKSAYARDTDSRYYITSRLDAFLSVDPGAAELLTKTLHPLLTKNVDANFVQTVAFVGSLSKTAEVNKAGMQRLAERLTHVQPEVRQQLSQVVTGVAQRSAAASREQKSNTQPAQVAARPSAESGR